MHSYSLTIGRNVSDGVTTHEMNDENWTNFKFEAQFLLDQFTSHDDSREDHEGQGWWEGEREASFKVTLLTENPLQHYPLKDLKSSIARLARRYNQDFIALTVGESTLIGKEG